MTAEFRSIRNGRALLPSGELAAADIAIEGSAIAAVEPPAGAAARSIDAAGLLVLPGIVDLHGDGFERQIMPRPGVAFPLDVALVDTDRQLLANGITTAFHALTCSWEPGLRGRDTAVRFVERLAAMRPQLGCDTRLHLRWETYNLAMIEEVERWMAAGAVHLLAFNDHLPEMHAKRGDRTAMVKYAERGQIDVAGFVALLERTAAAGPGVPAAIERLARAAAARGIALASHDDKTAADRQRYQALGCTICEFPMRAEAMAEAMHLRSAVVMGAPNVLRGHSHNGSLDATAAVAEGRCTILASDYYYPAQALAAFRLVREKIRDLAAAWALVSRNPARAAGLGDRGEIALGKRADLVLIDPGPARIPRVVATIARGKLVHVAGDAWRFA